MHILSELGHIRVTQYRRLKLEYFPQVLLPAAWTVDSDSLATNEVYTDAQVTLDIYVFKDRLIGLKWGGKENGAIPQGE